MNEAKLHPQLLGLVELDRAGTVLYSKREDNIASSDINGRNYFSEVAPFKNIEAFRQLISAFISGRDQANSVNFTCDCDGMTVPVRVLFARIREQSNGERTESVLVHIRER